MKKSDLKRIIKPLVKECIHEVLLEEGLLSNVVAEVAKGMQGNVLVETPPSPPRKNKKATHQATKSRAKLQEHRSSLMKSIGEEAYNGVNLFEGTEPIQNTQPAQGHADLGASSDAGVDISSLVGDSSAIWQALK
tara:strand:+ start:11775 stop:12179 length:405 start_codon:yes stop_codon:yes gene_type:complete